MPIQYDPLLFICHSIGRQPAWLLSPVLWPSSSASSFTLLLILSPTPRNLPPRLYADSSFAWKSLLVLPGKQSLQGRFPTSTWKNETFWILSDVTDPFSTLQHLVMTCQRAFLKLHLPSHIFSLYIYIFFLLHWHFPSYAVQQITLFPVRNLQCCHSGLSTSFAVFNGFPSPVKLMLLLGMDSVKNLDGSSLRKLSWDSCVTVYHRLYPLFCQLLLLKYLFIQKDGGYSLQYTMLLWRVGMGVSGHDSWLNHLKVSFYIPWRTPTILIFLPPLWLLPFYFSGSFPFSCKFWSCPGFDLWTTSLFIYIPSLCDLILSHGFKCHLHADDS